MRITPSWDRYFSRHRTPNISLCMIKLKQLFGSESIDLEISEFPQEGFELVKILGYCHISFRNESYTLVDSNAEFLATLPERFFIKVTPI